MVSRMSLAILALVLGRFPAVSAGRESASHLHCGDTITAGATLDDDLGLSE